MAYGTPGVHTHEQWLGLVQPVGLVVAPAVLSKLELFPNQGTAYLSARQRQLEALLEERETPKGEPIQVVPGFPLLATDLLDWGEADLVSADQLQVVPEVVLAEYGETLRPTHGVPKFEGEGLQALVLDLTEQGAWGLPFDEPWNPTGHGWDATPQQRFERLLKETEHPIGILFNGSELRLLHAPRGESSGWLTMPLEPMAEVAGRPMLGALELLLGVDRLFGGNPEQRLPALLVASRKNQNEVSTRLAEQVLEALWELLLGFDAAERVARDAGGTVLGELPTNEAGQKHLYGGLITVLLRLVFLLYAEDEALMPKDSLYGQHYSVSALADRLRQERFEHQGAMVDRRGAWASLLSLFRLVYDGGGADPAYLPARHGELFDPDAYPFLEGRDSGSDYSDGILDNLPAVSDDVVEKVLSRLLWLADASKVAQRLSYRSLDVEQIGSVYEGIMGFTVEGATGPSVGITYRPPRQKITITVVVDADQLLAQSGSKREKWLDEQAGVALKLPAKVKSELKSATSLAELCVALDKKLSPHTPNGLAAGSLILQPTAERRRSGSHYTPRALTEPIVAEAFRPWLERCNGQPTAEQILALKVCDPAMGSGAFLVAVCRYLAVWLVQAWERDGYPEGFKQEWDKDTVARRLIAQRCLYGVDKNPFAVNLAKLSLWLVTLSEHLPFTFVDHALKCGDSLVGYGVQEIQSAMKEVQLGFLNEQNQVFSQMGVARRESFGDDNLNDEGYDRKKVLLLQQIKASDGLRQAGDLMVAAFFDAAKAKDRAEKQQVYLAMLSGAFNDEGLQDSIQEIRDRLAAGDKGITPFHWDLEFPEVFGEGRGGFDTFVGNPPFIAGKDLSGYFTEAYLQWLQQLFNVKTGQGDICALFYRRAFELCRHGGTLSLLATNSICQGDTRRIGLSPIMSELGGEIYYALSRVRWGGAAAVTASMAAISKGKTYTTKVLNGSEMDDISAYLVSGTYNTDPPSLSRNAEKAFMGFYNYGEGFVFDNSSAGCESLESMYKIVRENPDSADLVHPFIGGDEILNSPVHKINRYVIDFEEMTEAEAMLYPELFEIIEKRVKPERLKCNRDRLREKWWQFGEVRPGLRRALHGLERFLCHPFTSKHLAFSFLPAGTYLASPHYAIASSDYKFFALVQCRVHECWVRIFASTLRSDLRYTASDCLETFPSPFDTEDLSTSSAGMQIEDAGAVYYQYRAGLLATNNEGLTSTYNRFNDPAETSSGLLELRRLHNEMDQAVLAAYGWSDVSTACGFGLDYLDIEEDAQVPDALQERIDSGELFFWDAGDALDFQGQLQAYGAITGRRKLPWRYRWPDSVRDDVLARLLALNAERYAEEVAMGLHSKGGKPAAGAKRGRKPKAAAAATPLPAFQLEPEPLQIGLDLSGGR